jgi:FAD/FMN-containing dehydrogenase
MNDAGALDSLGSRLQLPAGWTYRVRHPDEELICDTTDEMARVLQDEFENTYTVI